MSTRNALEKLWWRSTPWCSTPCSSSWTTTRSSSTSCTSSTLNNRCWGCSRRLSSLWRTRWTVPNNWSPRNARASGSSWRSFCRFTLNWLWLSWIKIIIEIGTGTCITSLNIRFGKANAHAHDKLTEDSSRRLSYSNWLLHQK